MLPDLTTVFPTGCACRFTTAFLTQSMKKAMENLGKHYGQILPGSRMGCAPRLRQNSAVSTATPCYPGEREIAIYTKNARAKPPKNNGSGVDLPEINAAAIVVLCWICTIQPTGRRINRTYQRPEIKAAPARITSVSVPALTNQESTLRHLCFHIAYPRMMFLVSRIKPTQNASNSMVRTICATPSQGDRSITIS